MCNERRKLYISTDLTSTPSEGSATGNLEQHFSYEQEVSVIQPQVNHPTSTGQLWKICEREIADVQWKGQDSGLFDRDHTVPPPTPHSDEKGGSATKAKTLVLNKLWTSTATGT